jgi:hypothetical protein
VPRVAQPDIPQALFQQDGGDGGGRDTHQGVDGLGIDGKGFDSHEISWNG